MASGKSARFGSTNKLLMPFRGTTLLSHTIQLVKDVKKQEPRLLKTIFVCAAAEAAAVARDAGGVRVLDNQNAQRGQRESIRLGARASNAAYLLFMPCDQGLLDAETILRLFAARAAGKICRPCYKGRDGSPVLFSRVFRAELMALEEGEHGRDLIARHPEALIRVETASPLPLVDFDTPEVFNAYALCPNLPQGQKDQR
jgi:molybdenum cofactor cytidylyltransferase